MKLSFLKEGTVLARIRSEEKSKIFQKDVEQEDGKVISFITALQASTEADEYFSQSVSVADIIAVADDVKHIQVGDIVVIDYTADTDESIIAFMEDGDKVISLDAETSYHDTDLIAYASMRTRMDTYTWRKGDVDKQSLIYAIYRNGILIPNNDYILLEHRDLTWTGETDSGIKYYDEEGDIVIRKIISATENSKYKVGDIVVVEAMTLFERSIEEYNFDIIMNLDVLGKVELPVN